MLLFLAQFYIFSFCNICYKLVWKKCTKYIIISNIIKTKHRMSEEWTLRQTLTTSHHCCQDRVEVLTFSLPHIFPNSCFLFISELNCMSFDYTFHLIDHMCYSSIFNTHMPYKIVSNVRVIFWAFEHLSVLLHLCNYL